LDPQQLLYTERLLAAKESVTRFRWVFGLSVIASLSITLALWNGYFSWYRFFALKPAFDSCDGCLAGTTATKPTTLAQEQLLKAWVESLIVTVSPLGMKFGVSDISFVGSTSLLILVTVVFYCARRENHTIAHLLIDSKDESEEIRNVIYYSVSSQLVFIPTGETDEPFQALEYSAHAKPRGMFSRHAVDVLIMLPALTVFTVVLVEMLSMFYFPAPFRQGHPKLWDLLKDNKDEITQYYLMQTFPIGVGLLITGICVKVRRYSHATVAVLRAYRALPEPQKTKIAKRVSCDTHFASGGNRT
jgi:hypothetical protein